MDVFEWLNQTQALGSKPGLDAIKRLLTRMGDPQRDFKTVHVTGTNGKGSTAAFIDSVLREAGYKVGKFTSPHLSSFNERITVNGVNIEQEAMTRILGEIRGTVTQMVDSGEARHPTFFEITTALAFKHFSMSHVDVVVLEVGMGGRRDATNVVDAQVSIVTNVSLEHTHVLGDTLSAIAREKAGIIKKGGTAVTATKLEEVYRVIREVSEENGSTLIRVGEHVTAERTASSINEQTFNYTGLHRSLQDLSIPLLGEHQVTNAATALAAVEALERYGVKVSDKAIRAGLRKVRWHGRLELVQRNPLVLLDSAKDLQAVKSVVKTVKEFDYDRLIVVVSISSDKNIPGMIGELCSIGSEFIVTEHRVKHRAVDPEVIASLLDETSKPYMVIKSVPEAVSKAVEKAGVDDMVLVIGSTFLIGEVREVWYPPESA